MAAIEAVVFPLLETLAFALVFALVLPMVADVAFFVVVALVAALPLTGVFALVAPLTAGAQTALPLCAAFWPPLHGTGPLAKEATDKVQAATKNKTRDLIFLKEFFLPTWSEFNGNPASEPAFCGSKKTRQVEVPGYNHRPMACQGGKCRWASIRHTPKIRLPGKDGMSKL